MYKYTFTVVPPIAMCVPLLQYMSEKKIRDYMQTQRSPTVGNRVLRPVIISESKGDYLKDQVLHPEERQIVWWNKRGTDIKKIPALAREKH